MSYSLGLTLYNLAAARLDDPVGVPRLSRPAGPLIWLHCPNQNALPAADELARRLIEDDGVPVLITAPQPSGQPDAIWQPPPGDTPRAARGFLDHWHPDVVVFSDGELCPCLLHECGQRGLPVLMVDANAPRLSEGRDGWYPGLTSTAISHFRQVFTLDESAAKAWAKAGAEPGQIVVSGRMEQASAALPYNESDRLALTHLLATRPIWLAADVAETEEDSVIAAHRDVLRLAHRLLLSTDAQINGRTAEQIVADIVSSVRVPATARL